MKSGPTPNPENSEIKMIFAPDSYRYAFEQPMAAEPGKSMELQRRLNHTSCRHRRKGDGKTAS